MPETQEKEKNQGGLIGLKEAELIRAIDNRAGDSATVSSLIKKTYEKNILWWENQPPGLDRILSGDSRARINVLFRNIESLLNNLTARPAKPTVVAANETPEAREVANDLEEILLRKYYDLGTKSKIKRALRHLILSRFAVIKPVWDPVKNDFDVANPDPRKVKVRKNASTEQDSDFVIEEIETRLMALVERFPKMEQAILSAQGMTKDQILIQDPTVIYEECWFNQDNFLAVRFKNRILARVRNPHWDWDGLKVTNDEQSRLESLTEKPPELNGRNRRDTMREIKRQQMTRTNAAFLPKIFNNYFDQPRKPYIFRTVFDIEDGPAGRTDLISQAETLQDFINRLMRTIDDASRWSASGVATIDARSGWTRKETEKLAFRPGVKLWGQNMKDYVDIKAPPPLASHVYQSLQLAINQMDALLGTLPTFRGEKEAGEKTAKGQEIRVAQSDVRLDEMIDATDYYFRELYNWQIQMMFVHYTEEHYIRQIGSEGAQRTISVTQDDLQQGIQIVVRPGQTLPENKEEKAARATQELEKGLIDPITYFEETGRERPRETLKRLVMWQANPMALLNLNEKEKAELAGAAAPMAERMAQTRREGQQLGAENAGNEEAVATRIEQIIGSDAFNRLNPRAKAGAIAQMKKAIGAGGKL